MHSICKHLLLIFAFLTATSQCWASNDPDLDLRQSISLDVKTAWEKGDFEALEKMLEEYLKPNTRTPSGKWKLALFGEALESSLAIHAEGQAPGIPLANDQGQGVEVWKGPRLKDYPAVQKQWLGIENKISRWQSRFPKSPHPVIARVICHKNKALYFRGDDWVKNVNESAWPIFHQELTAGADLLLTTRIQSQKNPIWFQLMLTIGGLLGANHAKIAQLASETMTQASGYPPALQSAFFFLQPKWGGSYQQMDDFARLANERTQNTEHGSLYARIYWVFLSFNQIESDSLFRVTKANWPLLRKSFEAMTRQYPAPRNFSGFAYLACIAGDYPRFKEMLGKSQTTEYYERWPTELKYQCPLH